MCGFLERPRESMKRKEEGRKKEGRDRVAIWDML